MNRGLLAGLAIAVCAFGLAFWQFGSTSSEVPSTTKPAEPEVNTSTGARKSIVPPSKPVEAEAPKAPTEPEKPSSAARPEKFDYASAKGTTGLAYRGLTPEDREKYQIPEKLSGVVVTDVDPRSGAAEAKLLPGDVIVQANFAFVTDETKLEQLVGDRKFTAITVYRNGTAFEVVLHKPVAPR